MHKRAIFVSFIAVIMMLLVPIRANATTINNNIDGIFNNIYLLEKEGITSTEEMEDWMDEYNQEQTCEGSGSILGDPEDEDSVAWLLQQVLNYIKVLGPILVVVLSSIDFAQVIVKSDDDAMKKAQKKLFTRLILAACLFFIPTLVQALLELFGIMGDPTCGLK